MAAVLGPARLGLADHMTDNSAVTPIEQHVVFPPRLDLRAFHHELTPTLLSAATVLAGSTPPPVDGPFDVVWLGCQAPLSPLLVAAVHPDATVTAWDPEPGSAAEIADLARRACIDNLSVHEHPDPPGSRSLVEQRAEVTVVDGVVDRVDDRVRVHIVDAVASLLRPGGLLAITYRTTVGWGEVTPLVHLLRHFARRTTSDVATSTADALGLLALLREQQAAYIASRPLVGAWLDELLVLGADEVLDRYVLRDLRPLSHTDVVRLAASAGASWIGGADPGDAVEGLPDALAAHVAEAPSSLLRETLGDLATRRCSRADLFRLGSAPEPAEARQQRLDGLQVMSVTPASPDHPGLVEPGGVSVADLWPSVDAPHRERLVRRALSDGALHPVTVGVAGNHEAALRMDRLLGDPVIGRRFPYRVAPALGTAIPVDVAEQLSDSHRAALGMESRR